MIAYTVMKVHLWVLWYKSLLPTNIFTDLEYYGIDDEQDAYYQNLLDQQADEEEG